jgi:hypothetical protein
VTAELVSIGSELTVGETRDTNAGELTRSLSAMGVRVGRMTALPDDLAVVADAFRDGLRRSDLVVSTGGLGPGVGPSRLIIHAMTSRSTGIRTMSPCRGRIPVLVVERIVPEVERAAGGGDEIIKLPACLWDNDHGEPFSWLKRPDELNPPVVAGMNFVRESGAWVLVSGGHTMLLDVPAWGDYRLLGETRDDAAGDLHYRQAQPGNGISKGIDVMLREGDDKKRTAMVKTENLVLEFADGLKGGDPGDKSETAKLRNAVGARFDDHRKAGQITDCLNFMTRQVNQPIMVERTRALDNVVGGVRQAVSGQQKVGRR